MLDVFFDRVRAAGWTVYPEQCGFDAVLVVGSRGPARGAHWPEGPREGDVVAVEGKLRGNLDVLQQIIPPWKTHWNARHMADGGRFDAPVADWYLVVVGGATRAFRDVALALGVEVHVPMGERPPDEISRWMSTRWEEDSRWDPCWHDRMRSPPEFPRLKPLLAVEQQAGLPAPRSITPWKVAAVRMCLEGGEITTKTSEVDLRRFVSAGWIEPTGEKRGRCTVYRLVEPPPPDRPDLIYPEIVAAIKAAP